MEFYAKNSHSSFQPYYIQYNSNSHSRYFFYHEKSPKKMPPEVLLVVQFVVNIQHESAKTLEDKDCGADSHKLRGSLASLGFRSHMDWGEDISGTSTEQQSKHVINPRSDQNCCFDLIVLSLHLEPEALFLTHETTLVHQPYCTAAIGNLTLAL